MSEAIASTRTSVGGGSSDEPTPWWVKYVAMFTGAMAALAGYLTVQSAKLSSDAIYNSIQAVLNQSKASDLWAEYQAQSVKKRVVETQLEARNFDAANEATLRADAADLGARQPALKDHAEAFEKKRDVALAQSQELLSEKAEMEYAGVAVELAIALASVAALTRRHVAFFIGAGAGLIGLGIIAHSLAVHYFAHFH